jgi:biotin-dependent carboxylase-like uncharacterized protein
MTATLTVLRAGPALTIQDLGRPFHVAKGLSTGGAADRIALFEAAALLNAHTVLPAIEMMGLGGTFRANAPLRFALTGAKMRVTLDDTVLAWNRTHTMQAGQTLTIGAVENGSYGYLTPAAPILGDAWLASRSTHLLAGIGQVLSPGDAIELGIDTDPARVDHKITPSDRFAGGTIRIIQGPQTVLFSAQTQTRFHATQFIRSPQANRQGVKLDAADTFAPETPQGLASDFIQAGDIQMTGDGVPFVLLSECQTIGGYPRIGTVIPVDLAKIAQAPIGARLQFETISLDDADVLCPSDAALMGTLRRSVAPCIRDPRDIADLLAYQLISGMVTGTEFDED